MLRWPNRFCKSHKGHCLLFSLQFLQAKCVYVIMLFNSLLYTTLNFKSSIFRVRFLIFSIKFHIVGKLRAIFPGVYFEHWAIYCGPEQAVKYAKHVPSNMVCLCWCVDADIREFCSCMCADELLFVCTYIPRLKTEHSEIPAPLLILLIASYLYGFQHYVQVAC